VLSRARLGHMFTIPVDQWTMDELVAHVRDEWMGRDISWCIRVQVRKANGKVMWSKLIDVYKKAGEGETKKQNENTTLFAEIRQLIADSEERANQRLREIAVRAVPAAPPMDMMALMKFMQESSAQNMQTLALLLNAMKPTTSGTNDILSMVKAMGEIRNFAGDLVPQAASEGDSPMGTVKALAPFAAMLTEIIRKRDGAPTHERKQLPAPPNAATAVPPVLPTAATPDPPHVEPSPTVPTQPIQPTEAQAKMLAELREQLLMLSQIAANKPDAKEVAATLLPMLPAEMDDMIYDTLSAENWFQRLTFIQPAIQPHKEWMTEVRNAILESFTEVKPGESAT